MPFAIRIYQTGGPEVLRWEEVALSEPAPDEVRIRQAAVGLNFIDVYHRTGLYPLPLPSGLGQEGAGLVEAVGAAVTDFVPGDRVAYASGPIGAYCDVRCLPAKHLLKLPDDIDFQTAASVMVQGLTSAYLLRKTFVVQRGDAVLIHAAAGGVGLIACQWAHALGAIVIGTVSSPAKAALAKQYGCDYVIDYAQENVAKRVREITGGEGVAVVYDGVGKETFASSLDSLRARGMMVSFGNASGAVPPVDILQLAQKGSLFLTRPTLAPYISKRQELIELGKALFDMVRSGKIKAAAHQVYDLADAASAHRALEARQTTGSTVLIPNA